jgi:hypothetical protein
MYQTQTQDQSDEGGQAALDKRLEGDVQGRLREQLLDEMRSAERDIEMALAAKPATAVTEVLQNLLGAVRLGERVVAETWDSFHG